MEEQMFDFLIDSLCAYLQNNDQQHRTGKKTRARSVGQTPKPQRPQLPKSKSQKLLKKPYRPSSHPFPKTKRSLDDQPPNKSFLSERKQKINQTCILCGKRPCDNRLACAHAIHQECFVRSSCIPRCQICQSKNIAD